MWHISAFIELGESRMNFIQLPGLGGAVADDRFSVTD
jgi:hypothetical protein